MICRFDPPETEVRYCGYLFKHPSFKRCSGELTKSTAPGYMYTLMWSSDDNSSHGRSEYRSVESLYSGMLEYSFDRLEIDSELVVELYAAGFEGEFIRIPDPYNSI